MCQKMDRWVPEQINPERSLGQMTDCSCPAGHLVSRQGSLGETVMSGSEQQQGERRLRVEWTHSVKEATG